MITETIKTNTLNHPHPTLPRQLKIVKQTNQNLLLTDGHQHMIFKTYRVPTENTLKLLHLRNNLQHQSIIKLHKIEIQSYATNQSSYPITCGILFEKYEKSLTQSATEMTHFSIEEIFQTLEPIKQAIDYFVQRNYDPGHLCFDSIVCTENFQIKFLDQMLTKEEINLHQRPEFKSILYEQFISVLFTLLFPQQRHVKSWKTRYEIASKHLSDPYLKYFQDLYENFAPSFIKNEKSKRIKKHEEKINKTLETKRSKRLKDKAVEKKAREDMLKWQEGKENQIIQ